MVKKSVLIASSLLIFSSNLFAQVPVIVAQNKRIKHHRKNVKALVVKEIAKPDESKNLKWQKVMVGAEAINGAEILGISEDSVWRRLDLRNGDIIIKINDSRLNSTTDLKNIIKEVDPNDSTLNLEIIRENQVFLIDYKLNW